MKRFNKALSLLLATLMLVTALPLGVLAADSASTPKTLSESSTESGQYFYKYTFDDLSAATKKEVGLSSWGNTSFNSNPMRLTQDGWVTSDVVVDKNNSANKYIHLDYSRLPANGGTSDGWRGLRVSLYEPSTGIDHLTANGVSIKFKFRWLGTDAACDATSVDFFKLRRKNAYGNGEIYLIQAETNNNGDLVLKAMVPTTSDTFVTRKDVYCFEKNSTEFSDIEIKYHDATASYSLIIDGKPIVESVYVGNVAVGKKTIEDNGQKKEVTVYDDVRSDYFVKKTYDNDFMTTSRQPLSVATSNEPTNTAPARRSAFELFRRSNSSIKATFVCDIDDFIIQEDQVAEDRVYYYKNTFDAYYDSESKDTYKPYNGLTGNYSNNMFKIQGTSSNLVPNYDKNTKNGYLTFNTNARLDLLDVYQVIQDGNWTVSFDIQATNTTSSLQTVIGLYDSLLAPRILQLDKDGYLYVGADKYKLTGAKIPAYGTNDWVNVKLSVFYTNENEGTFYNFIDNSDTDTVMRRCYAVYVDDKLIGLHTSDNRTEVSGTTLINNVKYTKTALSAEPTAAELEGYNLAEDRDTLKTWKNASGDLYQVKYTKNDDGTYSFASGVKVKMGSSAKGDTLSFFRPDEQIKANIDNVEVYSGIGNPNLAGGNSDTTGVINEVVFADINTTGNPTAVGNYTPANGGAPGIASSSNFSSSRVQANFETDAEGKKVNYVTLTSGTVDVYFGLNADNSGGKIFSAEMTLRNLSGATKDFYLLRLRRQAADASSYVTTDLLNYSYDKKCVVFTYNGTQSYLCDAGGKKVTLSGSDWTKIEAVIDETGSEPLVTFYVNDRIACYTTDSVVVPLKAANLSGIVGSDQYALKDAVDQSIRFFQTDSSSVAMDLLSAKIEYTTAPTGVGNWSDSVAVDFSKITNISQLGEQFIVSDGCYIENGALVIPDGETFGWVDYNGVFLDYIENHGVDPTYQYRFNDGYAIEAKLKTASTGSTQAGLMKLSYGKYTNKNFVYMQYGKLFMSSALSGYTLNDLSSGKFSEISCLFTNYSGLSQRSTVFADGKMVGVVGPADNVPLTGLTSREALFTFADNTEISELYIHKDQARTLALKSGNVFEFDPDAFLPKDNGRWPIKVGSSTGVWDSNKNAFTNYATVLTDDLHGRYYSFNFLNSDEEVAAADYGCVLAEQTWNDIIVTDYLEDKTTVFEYDIRFTPHASARNNVCIDLIGIRRTDDGASSALPMEYLLNLYEDGSLRFLGYTVCDKDGNPYKLDGSEWVKVSIIYDANAGNASCIINGKIYHCKKADGTVIGLANKVQLHNTRNYRMDAADTKIRFFNTSNDLNLAVRALGKLDIAGFKIYNTDGTANATFVGAQKDTEDANIRLVAGLDMPYYGRAGFEIEAFNADGTSIADIKKSYYTDKIYSSIKETVGTTVNTKYPENYGYRYFYTATVLGIPQDKAVKLNVTPFTEVNGVRYNSSTVTIDIDFTNGGEYCNYESSIDVKPHGTNTSSDANFSATDIVNYARDGALEFNGLDAKFAFAANLKGGVVSVNLTNAKGEVSTNSVFDIYVDGVLTKENVTLDFGHHTLVLAENLTGEHEFMIVKRSGGDFVCINHMSVYGTIITPPELATEDAIIVKVNAPSSGNTYGNVDVYVQTTDASGNYYMLYNFDYVKKSTNSYTYLTGKANTNANSNLYRIITAQLMEKTDSGFTKIYDVLQDGEVSLAIKEYHLFTVDELKAAGKKDKNGNDYTKDTNVNAPDYVGGFHGDENIKSVAFYTDGKLLDVTKAGTYEGITHFEFIQDTIINRCDEEEEEVMLHGQHILLDTNGLRLNQHIEFLRDDFYPLAGETFLQMATVYRIDTKIPMAKQVGEDGKNVYKKVGNSDVLQYVEADVAKRAAAENLICADVKLLDANGGLLLEQDLRTDTYAYDPNNGQKNVTVGEKTNTTNRYAEYLGNNNGLYGKVGFVIGDASVKSDNARLAIRKLQGDNKWYASFDTYNGSKVPLGEVWNVSDYYYFDYNTANIIPSSVE